MSGSEELRLLAFDKDEARAAAIKVHTHAQAMAANGERILFVVGPAVEPIGVQQRRFFHGPVLGQISEQVRVAGERFVVDVWKAYYKKLILERKPKYEMRRLPGARRATPYRVWHSTERLGTRAYSAFIDEVIAHAQTEFSVEFHFTNEDRALLRKRPEPKEEAHADEG